jgi:hypothetical protein
MADETRRYGVALRVMLTASLARISMALRRLFWRESS